MKQFLRLLILCLAFTLAACSEEKPTTQTSIIDQWYTALKNTDRAAFETLLAEDARIEILDLGITQTKNEYIEALDNWQEAAKDLNLTFEKGETSEAATMVEVCYEFPSNSFTNEETFKFEGGKITHHIQQQVSEGC